MWTKNIKSIWAPKWKASQKNNMFYSRTIFGVSPHTTPKWKRHSHINSKTKSLLTTLIMWLYFTICPTQNRNMPTKTTCQPKSYRSSLCMTCFRHAAFCWMVSITLLNLKATAHIMPIFPTDKKNNSPIRSMYDILTYVYHKNQPFIHVGKYILHGYYGSKQSHQPATQRIIICLVQF